MLYFGQSKTNYQSNKAGNHRKNICKTVYVLFCLILAGCNNYRVSLNERTIYTPPPLLKDIAITDEALRNCIKQTIVDQQITQLDQLKELNCSNAGIQSLTGLEQFSALSQLNLANNTLTVITPLSLLAQLTYLNLNNNQITNATSLKALINLRHLDLTDNPSLICASGQALAGTINQHTATEEDRSPAKGLLLPAACAQN